MPSLVKGSYRDARLKAIDVPGNREGTRKGHDQDARGDWNSYLSQWVHPFFPFIISFSLAHASGRCVQHLWFWGRKFTLSFVAKVPWLLNDGIGIHSDLLLKPML